MLPSHYQAKLAVVWRNGPLSGKPGTGTSEEAEHLGPDTGQGDLGDQRAPSALVTTVHCVPSINPEELL